MQRALLWQGALAQLSLRVGALDGAVSGMEVGLLAGCELITTTGLDDGQLCGACDSE